ncbi:MAG TPA: 1-phosphofructokinase family hexose kinase [Ruminiclostridium sp.]|nr:1-phosphofructokinase family hexose kinase [Ruminiclostridium sp.]
MITVLSLSPAVDKVYIVENFAAGGLYRVKNGLKSPGGKGINVARVARMLGTRVNVLGFKAGAAGQWLEESLIKIGADTHFIEVEGESRTNSNIIDRVNNTETEILEEGPTINRSDWERFLGEFGKSIGESRLLVCSGGLPKGLGFETYAELIKEANAKNIKTILDASGEVLKSGIESKPCIIKPNLRELSAYFNKQFESDSDIVAACREIIRKGVRAVVTSLGGDGAVLVTENQALKAFPCETEVKNTIGSGDSMVAGISAGIAAGMELEDCFRLGCACAASNTEFLEIGMIDKARVEELKSEIMIRIINV